MTEPTGSDSSWNLGIYPDEIRSEVPFYEELQREVVAQCAVAGVRTILELGVGTGETARQVLAVHPQARYVGLDSSEAMLEEARRVLPDGSCELRLQRLEDELPRGPFDLVVSALAVHHLDEAEKADLFGRVRDVTAARGRFVLGDLVVPRVSEDVVTAVNGVYDRPSSVDNQLTWLRAVGFAVEVTWERGDLAVLVAT